MVKCDDCGRNLHVDPVEQPNVDWVKVVCSDCGAISNISMVRISAETARE